MSTVAIKGIRIERLTLTRKDDGTTDIEGSYSLISSVDKILAKQSIGGYGADSMKFALSPATTKALNELIDSYRTDVQTVLGLDAQ